MYHFLRAGFFTPCVMWTTLKGKNCIYTNDITVENYIEAEYNLWEYMMWERIMEEVGER